MTALPSQKIRNLIEMYRLIENPDLDGVGPASYELRVGSALAVSDQKEIPIALDEEFVIREHSHILIGTVEKVNMPNNMLGIMFLKSRFGRAGFLQWGQGLVDPGYEGNLTISLLNLTPHPYIMRGGERICHLIFQKLEENTDKPYDGIYKGSVGASGPKEKQMKILGDVLGGGVSGAVGAVVSGLMGGD